ncbi:MAG: beta strand repeat-containing protein, partial [Actinomycetes bacterium]
LDTVQTAQLTFTVPSTQTTITDAGSGGADGDFELAITTAPTTTAEVTVGTAVGPSTDSVTDALASAETDTTIADGGVLTANLAAGASLSLPISITGATAAAGYYAGSLTISDGTNTLTVNFSFTTSGKPASMAFTNATTTVAAVNAATNTNTLSVFDASGNLTQIADADSIAIAPASTTNITLVDGSVSSADIFDGTFTVTVTSNGTADSEVVTATPAGTLVASGVSSKTFTATATAVGATTAVVSSVSAPSSATVIKSATAAAAERRFTLDSSVTSVTVDVSGWPSGSAYKVIATTTGLTTTTVAGSAVDLSGGANTVYGLSTGSAVSIQVTGIGSIAAGDTLEFDGNGDGDITDASDLVLVYAVNAYTNTLTTPAVTPVLGQTGAAVLLAGTVKDTFNTPVQGAIVSVSGSQTLSSGTAAALSGQAVTGTDGTWSLTMPAANALATIVVYSTTTTKTGLTFTDDSVTVNFSATGVPTSITLTPTVGNQTSTYPIVNVPSKGNVAAGDVTDETYTISTGADSTLGSDLDFAVEFTVSSSPAGQIDLSGTSGVRFSETLAGDWDDYTTTLSVASGATVYAITTRASAANTVTATSGSTTSSFIFRSAKVENLGARNVAISGVTTLPNGQVTTVTGTITDAYGNIVDTAANTVTATVTGPAFINGSSTQVTSLTSDSTGQFTVQLVAASSGTGTAVVTFTGVNNADDGTNGQFGALAGTIVPSATTAGTNGFTASTGAATLSVAITAATVRTADDAYTAATTAGDKADEAKAEAALATAAATTAGTKADAAKDAAAKAETAAAKAGTDAVAAADAAGVKADA